MVNLKVNKLRMMTAASVVVFTLASAPASAHHGHNIVGPAVAFIALGALLHHGHHGRHYGGHYGGHYGHYRPHRYKHHRRHSHSHGGYHKKRRKHYKH
jgi:hypothetical protein